MSINIDQVTHTFIAESRELLEQMESALLAVTRDGQDAVNAIFRAAHTIKGSAGMFGFAPRDEQQLHAGAVEFRDGRQVERGRIERVHGVQQRGFQFRGTVDRHLAFDRQACGGPLARFANVHRCSGVGRLAPAAEDQEGIRGGPASGRRPAGLRA